MIFFKEFYIKAIYPFTFSMIIPQVKSDKVNLFYSTADK